MSIVALACLAGPAGAEDIGKSGQAEVLYLHCFRQTTGQRVVVDKAAANDTEPAISPKRLVTLKVDLDRPFEVVFSSMHRVSGRVGKVDGELVVKLEGAFGSGFEFSGKVKVGEVFF